MRSQASAAVEMHSSVRWFETDVSGRRIGILRQSVFLGQLDPRRSAWPFKMRPTGTPETSALNQLTPRNNPEDERIQSTTAEACGHAWPWNSCQPNGGKSHLYNTPKAATLLSFTTLTLRHFSQIRITSTLVMVRGSSTDTWKPT